MKKLCRVTLVFILLFLIPNYPLNAQEEVYNNPITLEGSTLYANGNSIVLKKGDDGNTYAYGIDETTKLSEAKMNSVSTIYGGAKNKTVNGNVNIILRGISISTIYGGGYSDGSAASDVNGNVLILVSGNVNANSIHGGGYAFATKGNAQANVNGNVTIQVPAIPKGNHGNLQGGGTAYTNTAADASANVYGNIEVSITGRTYSLRGGGNATSNALTSGLASASVLGNIALSFSQVDIREIYGGGYAYCHAIANSGNIDVQVSDQSEVMILEGGGHASTSATANAGNITLSLKDCANLYGYIRGGGYANDGGNANVQNTNVSITNSILPADEQFDVIVAAGVYGGGVASGATSSATAENVTLNISQCETAATFYSGGESSSEGLASVKKANAYYNQNKGSSYNGSIYNSTVIAQGSSEDEEKASVGISKMEVSNCDFDGIWGGGESGGNPQAMKGSSHLTVNSELHMKTMANFDSIHVNEPIYVEKLMGKTLTKPTTIVVNDDMAVGSVLVQCDDIVDMKDTFTIDDNKLDYTIKNNVSIWSLGQMSYAIETKATTGGHVSASTNVNKFADTTITWNADPLYQVEKILLDGEVVTLQGNSYTLHNVQKTHTFEVQFKKIPGEVNDKVEIEQKPDTPKTSVDLGKDEIASLLNEEDKAAIADGKSITFEIAVEKAKEIPSAAEKKMQEVINPENILLHLDIQLFKDIDGAQSSIREANTKIRITVEIPEAILKLQNKEKFAILRTHKKEDGSYITTVLKDLDSSEKTITFETDEFSLYSLILDVPKVDVEKQTYSLRYYANGGVGSMKETRYVEKANVRVSANAFTRKGYAFSHWNTKADGSGRTYQVKDTFVINNNMTLYAQWNKVPSDDNSGTIGPGSGSTITPNPDKKTDTIKDVKTGDTSTGRLNGMLFIVAGLCLLGITLRKRISKEG